MAILVFAGVLSIPSAVFAEASWYGSLRTGVMSSNSKVSVFDGGSRWGVRGSADAGEGLTAVYQFEHKIDTARAGLDNPKGGSHGRLSYVGLSGGFGKLTLGQVWAASFNATGAMTDNSFYNGFSETTYRHGSAVSYAFSNDLMSLQADLVYADGPTAVPAANGNADATDDANEDLERTEFGLTVNIGDNAAVAVSHQNDKYRATWDEANSGVSTWETKTNIVAAQISVTGVTVYAGKKKESYDNTTAGTGALTETTKADDETTFFGARGSLGDTGMGYVFQWRDKDTTKPWILALSKSLGDSALLVFEHADNDGDANDTRLGLHINF